MILTRQEARERGKCDTCLAHLPNGRVKCGAQPLEGKYCPRTDPGKVDSWPRKMARAGNRNTTDALKQRGKDGREQCLLKLA